jgi:hypothetical protein
LQKARCTSLQKNVFLLAPVSKVDNFLIRNANRD